MEFKNNLFTPPRIGVRLLETILPTDFFENQMGDIEEEYQTRMKAGNYAGARLWFWIQVIRTALSCNTALVLFRKIPLFWRPQLCTILANVTALKQPTPTHMIVAMISSFFLVWLVFWSYERGEVGQIPEGLPDFAIADLIVGGFSAPAPPGEKRFASRRPRIRIEPSYIKPVQLRVLPRDFVVDDHYGNVLEHIVVRGDLVYANRCVVTSDGQYTCIPVNKIATAVREYYQSLVSQGVMQISRNQRMLSSIFLPTTTREMDMWQVSDFERKQRPDSSR
jgi:hypothetical protein